MERLLALKSELFRSQLIKSSSDIRFCVRLWRAGTACICCSSVLLIEIKREDAFAHAIQHFHILGILASAHGTLISRC